MSEIMERLQRMADALRPSFERKPLNKKGLERRMQEDKGCRYLTLPWKRFKKAAEESGFQEGEVEVEILKVQDIQKHSHERPSSHVVVLGDREGLPPPLNAHAYFRGEWIEVHDTDEFAVPAKDIHGFKLEGEGDLYLLVITSPPIVDPQSGYIDVTYLP